MSKYLDNTGAQHLISKIKTLLTGKSDTGHKHTKSDISDFPTIPTVNNAKLTIQKNGTTVKTFTANASSNVTANILVPTKVSELTNDSGYKTTDTTYSVATATSDGLMSSGDKTLLDSLIDTSIDSSSFNLDSIYRVYSEQCRRVGNKIYMNLNIYINATVVANHLYTMSSGIDPDLAPSSIVFLNAMAVDSNYSYATPVCCFINETGELKYSLPNVSTKFIIICSEYYVD